MAGAWAVYTGPRHNTWPPLDMMDPMANRMTAIPKMIMASELMRSIGVCAIVLIGYGVLTSRSGGLYPWCKGECSHVLIVS